MFDKITTTIAIFLLRNPVISKIITVVFTVLFIITGVGFANSDFKDIESGVSALFYLVLTTIFLYTMINKSKILSFNLTDYFVENQNREITDDELKFFYREAEFADFKLELERYIESLGRKALIKECIIKCLELKKSKKDMSA